MNYRLFSIKETCEILHWGETKFYERVAAGLFPRPFNVSGSKKGNTFFEHEIAYYIQRAIHISSDSDFKALAKEIELNRLNLAA